MTNTKLKIELPDVVRRQYDIVFGRDYLESLIIEIGNMAVSNVVIVTDNNVEKLYGEKILADFGNSPKSYVLSLISFKAGEDHKTQETVIELQNKMFELGCGRNTLVVALGGGVVGDIAGFVASSYKRGVLYVQIPTTLLSMCDSSVGGKTGFNTVYGKNTIGAFWQPKLVLIDVDFLKTLPRQQIINGLVEAMKVFLTNDKKQFDWLENNLDKILNYDLETLQELITNALKIKSVIVERDEKEIGERMILNFGHSVGHTLETLSDYKFLHGEAVALGIIVEAKIASRLGILKLGVTERIEKIINKLDLSVEMLKEFKVAEIMELMRGDKKNDTKQKRLVVLQDVGQVYVKDSSFAQIVDDNIIEEVLKNIINK